MSRQASAEHGFEKTTQDCWWLQYQKPDSKTTEVVEVTKNVYLRAAAPEMISTSSLVMTAWRCRLYFRVNLSIISPANAKLSVSIAREIRQQQITILLATIHKQMFAKVWLTDLHSASASLHSAHCKNNANHNKFAYDSRGSAHQTSTHGIIYELIA